MTEDDYRELIHTLCRREGATEECAFVIAQMIVASERKLSPPAWQTRTPNSLAESTVARAKELHPRLFLDAEAEEVVPQSALLTSLRNELLERYGISDPHQIAAIIPFAIRYKTVKNAREREPDLFTPAPTRDELYELLITTNPSEAETDAENAAYARARVKSAFAAGEAWLEAAALVRRASILNDLAHNSGIAIGSAPAGTSSSLVTTTGISF